MDNAAQTHRAFRSRRCTARATEARNLRRPGSFPAPAVDRDPLDQGGTGLSVAFDVPAQMRIRLGVTINGTAVPKLLSAGAAAVFPTGTPLDVSVRDIRALTGVLRPALKETEEPCASE